MLQMGFGQKRFPVDCAVSANHHQQGYSKLSKANKKEKQHSNSSSKGGHLGNGGNMFNSPCYKNLTKNLFSVLGPLALHKFKYCFILQLTPNHMFILRVNITVHFQINIWIKTLHKQEHLHFIWNRKIQSTVNRERLKTTPGTWTVWMSYNTIFFLRITSYLNVTQWATWSLLQIFLNLGRKVRGLKAVSIH